MELGNLNIENKNKKADTQLRVSAFLFLIIRLLGNVVILVMFYIF